nr:toll/interleukin-1 receptor domain-containing protein [Actinomycetota bacterium]
GIDTTSFLLVILTPSYVRSTNCRKELERFLRREQELGRDDLILPVYYGSIPENSADDLTKKVLERQYVDWRHLRFQSFDDIPVRMAVAALAASVASALARTANGTAPRQVRDMAAQDLGLLERFAEMELAMPRLLRGVLSLSAEQEGVTEETQQATEEMSRLSQMGRGSTARLIVARRLSSRLEPYADRMEDNAQAIRSDLNTIELGIRAMAGELPTSSEEGVEGVAKSLIESMEGAQLASEQASVSVDTMGESYSEVARSASSLRQVLQRLLGSARVVTECAQRFGTWTNLLEDALDARAD